MSVDTSGFVNSGLRREDFVSSAEDAGRDAETLESFGDDFRALAEITRSADLTVITEVPTENIDRVSKLTEGASGGKDAQVVLMKDGRRFIVIEELSARTFEAVDDAGVAIKEKADILGSILNDGYNLHVEGDEYEGIANMTRGGLVSASFGADNEVGEGFIRYHWTDSEGVVHRGMGSRQITSENDGDGVGVQIAEDRKLLKNAIEYGAALVGKGFEAPRSVVESVEDVDANAGFGDARVMTLRGGGKLLAVKSLDEDVYDSFGEMKGKIEEEVKAAEQQKAIKALESDGYTFLTDDTHEFDFASFMDGNGKRVGSFGDPDNPAPGMMTVSSDEHDFKYIIDGNKQPDLYDRALSFRDNLMATEQHQAAGWSIWNADKFKTGDSQLRDIKRSSIDHEAGIIRIKFWHKDDRIRDGNTKSDAFRKNEHSGEWIVFSEKRTPEAFDVVRRYIAGPRQWDGLQSNWTGNDHTNRALNAWYADPRWADYVPTNDLNIDTIQKEIEEWRDMRDRFFPGYGA